QARLLPRGGVIVQVLVVDWPVLDARPARLAHGLPAAERVHPPAQHPVRLALLGPDEAGGLFGEPPGGLVGFDMGDESIRVLIDVDAADLLDGLLYGRHSSLRCGFKDRGLDRSVMVVAGAKPLSASGGDASFHIISMSHLM